MARKITTGEVGGASGGLNVTNTGISAASDLDITIEPQGTGVFRIDGDTLLTSQGDLRFGDADSSNWVAFQGPSTIASNVTWSLPAADGSASQVLTTNGSGTLSWTTSAITISNNTADATTNYIAFTTSSSGTISAARVSTSGLTFQPSTGTLGASAAAINGTVASLTLENTKSTDYTLALVDRNRVVNMNNAGAATVTIPTNASVAFPIGSVVFINRTGAGTVTLAGAGGVTLSKTGIFAANEEMYVRKRDTDSWIVVDVPKNLVAGGGSITYGGGYTTHTYTGSGSFVL